MIGEKKGFCILLRQNNSYIKPQRNGRDNGTNGD